jgi:predicted nucleotidyltransferase
MCTELQLKQVTHEASNKIQNVLGDKLHKIILFGSYARGDYDDESDVDLMVIADMDQQEEPELQRSIDKISSDVSLKNDITVCILLKDKQLFDERVTILPFYRNVANEGIEVYGA